jgi:hypothetical protein
MSNGKLSEVGTSFAAPHVTGIAALIAGSQSANNHNDLTLGTTDGKAHLGYKAIILNSARKRGAYGPSGVGNPYAQDHPDTRNQPSDQNYMEWNATGNFWHVLKSTNAPQETAGRWTPSNWTTTERTLQPAKHTESVTYNSIETTSPLDDEQGTGVADAERALIQYHGGDDKTKSGKTQVNASGTTNVSRYGWNIGGLARGNAMTPPYHEYLLNFDVKKGEMITATLVWDAILKETEAGGGAGDNKVELGDTYAHASADGKALFANFDLTIERKIYNNGGWTGTWEFVGTSSAAAGEAGDNVEHLHVPAPVDGKAEDYRITAELKKESLDKTKPESYAIAWWIAPKPPV